MEDIYASEYGTETMGLLDGYTVVHLRTGALTDDTCHTRRSGDTGHGPGFL
jgi:hypothetical protein